MINIEIIVKLGGVRNSAVASQPCPSGHITERIWLRWFAPSPKSILLAGLQIRSKRYTLPY